MVLLYSTPVVQELVFVAVDGHVEARGGHRIGLSYDLSSKFAYIAAVLLHTAVHFWSRSDKGRAVAQ